MTVVDVVTVRTGRFHRAREDRTAGVRLILLLAMVAVWLSHEGTAFAQPWHIEYEDGKEAIESEDWATAVELLTVALEKRPEQSRDLVRYYGTVFQTYKPEFYLAVAYVNLGRIEEAVALLEKVAREGLVIEGDDEFPQYTSVLAEATRGMDSIRATTLLANANQAISAGQFVEAGRLLDEASGLGISPERLAPYRERIETGVRRAAERDVEVETAEVRRPSVDTTAQRIQFESLLRQARQDLEAGRLDEARRVATEAGGFGIQGDDVDELLNRVTAVETALAEARTQAEAAMVQRLEAIELALAAGQLETARARFEEVRQLDAADTRVMDLGGRVEAAVAAEAEALNTQFVSLLANADQAIGADQFVEAGRLLDEASGLGISPERLAPYRERITQAEGAVVLGLRETLDSGGVEALRVSDPPSTSGSAGIAQLERSALLMFYEGDYNGALVGLGTLISEAPNARAYLFRASSRVAAGLLSSDDEDTWLTQAVEDFERAVRDGVDPEAYHNFISPRIMRLLQAASAR